MPVIETTLIAGYDDETKLRLMKGMARVVRSVIAAVPDGTITVIREVSPSSYARGGMSRTPGPALPPAADVVTDFTKALAAADKAKAVAFLTPEFASTVDLESLMKSAAGRSYSRFDESVNDETVLIFAEGTVGSGGFIERYTIAGKLISGYAVWNAA
jgi:phenylpyruvate tautomerase PptA (4-oxalocrotonate tautomerase family)